MRISKVNISKLMIVTAVIAIDIGVIRELYKDGYSTRWQFLAIGFFPFAGLLVLLVLKLIADLRRTSTSSPFLTGFLIAGFGTSVASIVYWLRYDNPGEWLVAYMTGADSLIEWFLPGIPDEPRCQDHSFGRFSTGFLQP
jgi:hypothetical protein